METIQPLRFGALIIVDERDQVTGGTTNGTVPGQGNVLHRFQVIANRETRACHETRYHLFGRPVPIVVDDDDLELEELTRRLRRERLQQPGQECRSTECTHAHGDSIEAIHRAMWSSRQTCLTGITRAPDRHARRTISATHVGEQPWSDGTGRDVMSGKDRHPRFAAFSSTRFSIRAV